MWILTRMHSSRMRIICCSGHLGGGGVCLGGGCLPKVGGVSALGDVCLEGVSTLRGVCPGGGVSAQVGEGGVYPGRCLPGGCTPPPPVDGILDTCL